MKAIWEVSGASSGGVASTKDVAARLSVSPASVSNMFGRLREMGLVEHERYRGVALTGRGSAEALRLVRRHRLIEAFLVEHLGYSWREVHGEAERLEHAVSDGFTERLADFLGHPARDPHGVPIPDPDGTLASDDSYPLREAPAGRWVLVHKVEDESAPVLDHLGGRGLVPGRSLKVVEARELDGVVTVEDGDGGVHVLGEPLARAVSVRDEARRDA